MKPFDENGRELDAIFTVEPWDTGAALILESRGGGEGGPRLPRNADYGPALELLLRRLGSLRAVLVHIEVDSRVTRTWAPQERRLEPANFLLPLDLIKVTDVRDLRLQIGRQSTVLGRREGQSGGNPTKRLRLNLRWPFAVGKSVGELEDLLGGQRRDLPNQGDGSRYAPLGAYLQALANNEVRLKLSEIEHILYGALPREAWTPQFWANAAGHHASRRGEWLDSSFGAFFERRTETVLFRRLDALPAEAPTADPDELRVRASRAKARMSLVDNGHSPPQGSASPEQTSASVSRYVRDPEVVAWVLSVARGACEHCGEAAPFAGSDGEPFLEVHHVRPLGDGGPDQIDNAVGVCPNCHRQLHYGIDRQNLRDALIARVERLRDYPEPAPNA